MWCCRDPCPRLSPAGAQLECLQRAAWLDREGKPTEWDCPATRAARFRGQPFMALLQVCSWVAWSRAHFNTSLWWLITSISINTIVNIYKGKQDLIDGNRPVYSFLACTVCFSLHAFSQTTLCSQLTQSWPQAPAGVRTGNEGLTETEGFFMVAKFSEITHQNIQPSPQQRTSWKCAPSPFLCFPTPERRAHNEKRSLSQPVLSTQHSKT